MKFGLMVSEGPYTHQASDSAYQFAVAALAGMVLVALESRRGEPLVDLRYFRSAPFSGAALIGVVALATLGGFLFICSSTRCICRTSAATARCTPDCSRSRWPRCSACCPPSQAGW